MSPSIYNPLPRSFKPTRPRGLARLSNALILGLLSTGGAATADPEPSSAARTVRESTVISDDGPHALGRSLKNLDPSRWMPMRSGKRIFVHRFRPAGEGPEGLDGLGPLFNADSCSSCHFRDGRGSRPSAASPALTLDVDPLPTIFRLAHLGTGAADSSLGRQLQDRAVAGAAEGSVTTRWVERDFHYPSGETVSLRKPLYERSPELSTDFLKMDPQTRLLPRIPPTLVGMGLLESVPAHEIAHWQDPDDADGDGISGRARWMTTEPGEPRVGRFGWKAAHPDLRSQASAALRHDMGIEPSEIDDDHLEDLLLYLRLLAPPAQRDPNDPRVQRGEVLFSEIGCDACHRPSLTTGSAGEIPGPPELADQRLRPYTDLLLHDMGEELADDAAEPGASRREWRTAPLWGLGLLPVVNGERLLLHDGRARTFEEAILWHGGEARDSRTRFSQLETRDRRHLIAFLESL